MTFIVIGREVALSDRFDVHGERSTWRSHGILCVGEQFCVIIRTNRLLNSYKKTNAHNDLESAARQKGD